MEEGFSLAEPFFYPLQRPAEARDALLQLRFDFLEKLECLLL